MQTGPSRAARHCQMNFAVIRLERTRTQGGEALVASPLRPDRLTGGLPGPQEGQTLDIARSCFAGPAELQAATNRPSAFSAFDIA